MEPKECNEAVGKIMGVKAEVKWFEVRNYMATGEVMVMLLIKPSEIQVKKLMALVLNSTAIKGE